MCIRDSRDPAHAVHLAELPRGGDLLPRLPGFILDLLQQRLRELVVPVALYYQLKESLLQKIQDENWKPGQKIPTERELCEMYGVSRITVRTALDDLHNEAYLYRIQGKGTYVKRSSIDYRLSKFYSLNEELSRRGLKERAQMLSFSKVVPEDKVRAQLHQMWIRDSPYIRKRARRRST